MQGFRRRNPLSCRFILPFLGFDGIAFDTKSLGIHLRESKLRGRVTLIRGFATPFECFFRTARHAAADLVIIGNFCLGLRHALKCRAEKPFVRFVIRMQAALAILIHEAESILIQGVTVFGAKPHVIEAGVLKFRAQPGAETRLHILR